MKLKMLGIFLALGTLLAGSVQADDRDYYRRDFDRHGDRYYDSRSAGRSGYFVPRWATDVGDGWIIGSKREDGGFAIYRWSGFHWQEVHGAGIRIGGSYARPWHINDRGHRYVWNGHEWIRDYGHGGERVFRPDRARRSNDSFLRGFRRDLRRDYHYRSDRYRRYR